MSVALSPEILAHIVPARRLEERRGFRPSGVASLDEVLGGGWPRGALAELRGQRSSGRTAILYASLASSIGAGQTVALVDVGGALDPRAAEAAGIVLPRLLWIRSAPGQVLKATDLVVSAGGFDLVALDLGDARPRAPTAAWIRLKHGAERQGTTILVATPVPAVGSFATAAVEIAGSTPEFPRVLGCPTWFAGLRAEARRARGKRDAEDSSPCAWLAFSHRD
jgi:hypothetical protein